MAAPAVDSKLAPPVQDLMARLFDVEQMNRFLLEFEIDTDKMPLGKLTKGHLRVRLPLRCVCVCVFALCVCDCACVVTCVSKHWRCWGTWRSCWRSGTAGRRRRLWLRPRRRGGAGARLPPPRLPLVLPSPLASWIATSAALSTSPLSCIASLASHRPALLLQPILQPDPARMRRDAAPSARHTRRRGEEARDRGGPH